MYVYVCIFKKNRYYSIITYTRYIFALTGEENRKRNKHIVININIVAFSFTYYTRHTCRSRIPTSKFLMKQIKLLWSKPGLSFGLPRSRRRGVPLANHTISYANHPFLTLAMCCNTSRRRRRSLPTPPRRIKPHGGRGKKKIQSPLHRISVRSSRARGLDRSL